MNNKIFIVTISDSDGYVQHRALVNIHFVGCADNTMKDEAISHAKKYMVIGFSVYAHATSWGSASASITNLSWSWDSTLTIWQAQYQNVAPYYGSNIKIDSYSGYDSGWKLEPDTFVSASNSTPLGVSNATASTTNTNFYAGVNSTGAISNLHDFSTSSFAESSLWQHESTICVTAGYGKFTLTANYDIDAAINIDPNDFSLFFGEANSSVFLKLYGSQRIGGTWVDYSKSDFASISKSITTEEGVPASYSDSKKGTLSVTMNFVDTSPYVREINVQLGTYAENAFTAVVPEPTTMLLLGLGLVGLAGIRRKFQK